MPLVFQDKPFVVPNDCLTCFVRFLAQLVFLTVQLLPTSKKISAVTVGSLRVNLNQEWNIFIRGENLCEPASGEAPVDRSYIRRQGPVVA